MALFNRSSSVQVDIDDERLIISNVRISFICEKTSTATKNSATIRIFNLSETTRDSINTEDAKVTLFAGYVDDAGEELLFTGDVVYIKTDYVPPDLITEFELKDGGNALRDAKLNESFEAGTTTEQIINKLVKATGLPIKEITADLKKAYANGLSVSGSVGESIDKVLGSINAEWSVLDNEIQIIEKDSANSDKIIVLKPSSGLIGLPAFIVDDKNQLPDAQNTNGKLKIESLLMPKLNPTRRVKLESRIVSGVFRIDSVIHNGDTHSQMWKSEIKVTAV